MKYRYLLPGFFIKMIFLFSILTSSLQSQDPKQSVINIGNITSWVRNDGLHPWEIISKGWNGSFPKGDTIGTIYSEGLVWGGYVADERVPAVRVNGSTYFNGNVPITRLFRVRKYYKDEDLRDDAANFFIVPTKDVTDSMITQIYEQYKKDWIEWPADKGAPFMM
jgi:hypothetical protein